jgi:hypothetical protein
MNHEVQPGFIADMAQRAGRNIEGLGSALEWGGYALTTYGLLHGLFSALKIGRNVLQQMQNPTATFVDGGGSKLKVRCVPFSSKWKTETGEFAIDRLSEVGFGLVLGYALSRIGKPVTDLGNLLHARETQCQIGQALTLYEL